MEPRVLSVCWIPKGSLQTKPEQVLSDEKELEKLAKVVEDEEDMEELTTDDETENNNSEDDVTKTKEIIKKKENRPELDDEMEEVWDTYNFDDYDDEPNELALNIGSLVVPSNLNEYEIDYDNTEDDDDITLKENDSILLAGVDSPDGTATVEVRIFNMDDEFYVRNDISLDSPPLCLSYINFEIGQETEDDNGDTTEQYADNFVAVGCLKGQIQIWDLDILDAPGPAFTLIGHDRDSMVISLSWNNEKLLASGGSDGKVIIWSLETGIKIRLGYKTNSPVNQVTFSGTNQLLAADADGKFACYELESDTWKKLWMVNVMIEIEKVSVCPSGSLAAIGTSDGVIRLLHIQEKIIIAKWNAHPSQPITGLEFKSSQFLFSSGHDQGTQLILWNLHLHQWAGNEKKIPIAKFRRTRQTTAGKLFCATISPENDSDLVLTGGEVGGPQVLKLSRTSKNRQEESSDEDEFDSDGENELDSSEVKQIKEEEWETDTGSSEGEEMLDDDPNLSETERT